ncbi:FAD/NAD(P)-dependent oxidoreductase [Novosphingobium naphthalenivorans]|uniref:FAD/NAD(P)-dependent oxidoreductase n=1 Tax=Novosphingobium naphthalenivorans TaxID=273168 RepID=UPI000A60EA3D|nr:NAD(P)/FAD-dependent oxidoreductase [Novosphingobium naphthalenivorans]
MAGPQMTGQRVIVVGAGPAGVRAAEALVAAGLRPLVIDEGRRDGGQIYRRQPEGFTRGYQALYGTEAVRARAAHETFDALKESIDYWPETLVWNVSEGQVWTHRDGIADAVPYAALIVCAGATDRLLPVKGWNLAGCYSLGGAQIALKAQACAIGRKVAFLGTGPLLYLVASQYLKAGANVAAVLDTAPLSARIAALPKLAAQPDLLWTGAKLTLALKRAGVPVLSGVTPIAIEGSPETGVSAVRVRTASGSERAFECDAMGMGWHLRPETQIADLARCAFGFDAKTGHWLPECDEDGRASAPQVYLAGDGARILGARCAEVTGELAAMAALADLGRAIDTDRRRALLSAKAGYRRFADGLAQAFPWRGDLARAVSDDTVVCRCENVTAGTLRASVTVGGATEANRAKAYSRVGMGRCQGRYCGAAGAEIVAEARGCSLEAAGRLRGQAPVKPIGLSTRRAGA